MQVGIGNVPRLPFTGAYALGGEVGCQHQDTLPAEKPGDSRSIGFSFEWKKYISLTGINLVGGFNPSEKYAPQIGSFPQVGVKIKKNETTT